MEPPDVIYISKDRHELKQRFMGFVRLMFFAEKNELEYIHKRACEMVKVLMDEIECQ
jgi:hypothetical protein